MVGTGYDAAESNAPFESYQDFGHNHWHNSLIRGEGIHDVAIFGPGLICGRGLVEARWLNRACRVPMPLGPRTRR